MDRITQRQDGSKLYKLSIDINNYHSNSDLTSNNCIRRLISVQDDTKPAQVDSARLIPIFHSLRAKDFKYYFYLLSLLERNDKPISIKMQDVKQHTLDKTYQCAQQGILRLVKAGLIFPVANRRSTFIINPVYAWKGNRLDYLDCESLPML